MYCRFFVVVIDDDEEGVLQTDWNDDDDEHLFETNSISVSCFARYFKLWPRTRALSHLIFMNSQKYILYLSWIKCLANLIIRLLQWCFFILITQLAGWTADPACNLCNVNFTTLKLSWCWWTILLFLYISTDPTMHLLRLVMISTLSLTCARCQISAAFILYNIQIYVFLDVLSSIGVLRYLWDLHSVCNRVRMESTPRRTTITNYIYMYSAYRSLGLVRQMSWEYNYHWDLIINHTLPSYIYYMWWSTLSACAKIMSGFVAI